MTMGSRLGEVLSLVLAGLVAGPASAEEKLTPGSLLAAACAACHNTQGRSVEGMPALAGISREQFVTTFREFSAGTRKATVMRRHAEGYNDREIELLADYFSVQKR